MRKLFTVLAVTLGLLVAAAPADATPPGWFYLPQFQPLDLTAHACRMEYTHGQFGSVSFARVSVLGAYCQQPSGVRVYAWGAESRFCTFSVGDQPTCDEFYDYRGAVTLQATVTGSLIGGVERFVSATDGTTTDLYLTPIP